MRRALWGVLVVGDRSVCRLIAYHILNILSSVWFFALLFLGVAAIIFGGGFLFLVVALLVLVQVATGTTVVQDLWHPVRDRFHSILLSCVLVHVQADMWIRNVFDVRRAVAPRRPSSGVLHDHLVPLALYFILWNPVVAACYAGLLIANVFLMDDEPPWQIAITVAACLVLLYGMAWIMAGVTQGIVVPLFQTDGLSSPPLSSPIGACADERMSDRHTDDLSLATGYHQYTRQQDTDMDLYLFAVPSPPYVASVWDRQTTESHEAFWHSTRRQTADDDGGRHQQGDCRMDDGQASSKVEFDSPRASLYTVDAAVHVRVHQVVPNARTQPTDDDVCRPGWTSPPVYSVASMAIPPPYALLSPKASVVQLSQPPIFRSTTMVGDDGTANKQDAVHFFAYAPAAVAVEMNFSFAIWAFLVNQREDMHDQAKAESTAVRQLSREVLLPMRRGAMAHVRLEVPDGFEVLDDPVKAFSWTGDITSVKYHVQCTSSAPPGQVLFQATIVVGAKVMTLKSYVFVSPTAMALESEMAELSCELEMLPETFEEIPYHDLDFKELVGRGNFGDAYRAEYNGKEVVVKTIRAQHFGDTNDEIVREFRHEAAVLNMFGHHPNIVPFVGASTDLTQPLALVTEYVPDGSLESKLGGPTQLLSLG
ncbi:hypothetical protein As57867_019054, partial [Aphanomyces stellatus]